MDSERELCVSAARHHASANRFGKYALVPFLIAAAVNCCKPLQVPGLGPLVGPPPRPLVPEATHCGFVGDRPLQRVPEKPIVGVADYHIHQFANLGFGGRFLWGDSYNEAGIAEALSDCGAAGDCVDEKEDAICKGVACLLASDPDQCRANCESLRCTNSKPHGHLGVTDPVAMVLSKSPGHQVSGYPDFVGWPHWNTYTHQQVYHRWLRRAFDGGLRLIVNLAVSNEVLCRFLGNDHACDDMTNVKLQIDAAKKLEEEIDRENDCEVNGNGWYRIARSPSEARKIIADGAMAVVLGVEVDTILNCYRPDLTRTGCSAEVVRKRLADLRESGVRHVFPIHLIDNGFGGTGAYNEFFNWGNAVVNHGLLKVRNCSKEAYEFHYGEPSTRTTGLIAAMARYFGVPYGSYKDYPAQCNARGLEPLGCDLIQALMDQKLIIDVDHMSVLSRKKVLDLAEWRQYPGLVSGHSGFFALYRGDKKSEGQLTDEETNRLLDLGGLLAPILHHGETDELITYAHASTGTKVVNDCGNSAKSFAQGYLYAVDKMKEAMKRTEKDPNKYRASTVLGVGYGSDLNGLAGMPTPRFGPFACGGDGNAQTHPVKYPLTAFGNKPMDRSQAGHRVFDINVDGFAHVGMLPDFIAELAAIGLTERDLAPLWSSAEAYISMWERVENWKPMSTTAAPKCP